MDISSLTIQMKAARWSVAFDVDYFLYQIKIFFQIARFYISINLQMKSKICDDLKQYNLSHDVVF